MQKRNISFIALFMLAGLTLKAQDPAAVTGGTLMYSDDFSKPLDTSRWIVERMPEPGSSVYTKDNKLVLDTKGGVTVWLNKPLAKNIRIEYDRKIVVAGGANDRLSDCNNFWMASDPRNNNLFTR